MLSRGFSLDFKKCRVPLLLLIFGIFLKLYLCGPVFADYQRKSLDEYFADRSQVALVSNKQDLKKAVEENATSIEIPFETNAEELTSMDLEQLSKCTQLKRLFVDSRADEYASGKYLTLLKNLEILYMASANDEAMAQISESAPLRKLSVQEGVTDKSMPYIGRFAKLEELGLRGCPITDHGLKLLQQLRHLKELDLCGTKITGRGLSYLANNKQLKHLDLSGNEYLGDIAMRTMKFFPDLRILYINDTPITDLGFVQVGQLHNLEGLHFGDTKVTDLGMKVIRKLTSLKDVSFWRLKITDEGMQYFARLQNIESLYATEMPLTDKTITYLYKLPKLKRLSLDDSQISDNAFKLLKEMPPAVSVGLKNTKVTAKGLEEYTRELSSHHKSSLSRPKITSGPLVLGDGVFIQTDLNCIWAFDKFSGQKLWSKNAGCKNASIIGTGDKIIYVSVNETVMVKALLSGSGDFVWQYSDNAPVPIVNYATGIALAHDSSRLYIVWRTGRVVCLSLKDGKCLWDKQMPSAINYPTFEGCLENAEVCQDEGMLVLQGTERPLGYFESGVSWLFAVNKNTGEVSWSTAKTFENNRQISATIFATYNCLVLAMQANKECTVLQLFDKVTGKLLEEKKLQASFDKDREYRSSKVIFDEPQNKIFYIDSGQSGGDENRVVVVDLVNKSDHVELQDSYLKSQSFPYANLEMLQSNKLFIGSGLDVICLDANKLEQIWKLELSPSGYPGRVLAADTIKGKSIAVVYLRDKTLRKPSDYADLRIVAFDMLTSKRLWSFMPYGFSNCIYDSTDKLLFAHDINGELFCCNLVTGKLAWVFGAI